MAKIRRNEPLPVLGWREWVVLPDLGEIPIKTKVDTGARSSAIHAFDVVRFERQGDSWVRFRIHPLQRDTRRVLVAEALLIDERRIRSSSGHETVRPVIETRLRLGGIEWRIDLTLVRRDLMGFRMLLGRQAVRHRFLIDPGRSYLRSQSPAVPLAPKPEKP